MNPYTKVDWEEIFMMGWAYGAEHGEQTPGECDILLSKLMGREVSQAEVDTFGQGTIDGSRGDRFRCSK